MKKLYLFATALLLLSSVLLWAGGRAEEPSKGVTAEPEAGKG
jgi:hypothetical protein